MDIITLQTEHCILKRMTHDLICENITPKPRRCKSWSNICDVPQKLENKSIIVNIKKQISWHFKIECMNKYHFYAWLCWKISNIFNGGSGSLARDIAVHIWWKAAQSWSTLLRDVETSMVSAWYHFCICSIFLG